VSELKLTDMLNYGECRVNVYTELDLYGKPKGSQIFTFVIDTDMMMYCKEKVIESIEEVLFEMKMVDDECGECDYLNIVYKSHDVVFFEPSDITREVNEVFNRKTWWERTQLQQLHEEGDE
jgi:hypothetical protein